MIDHDAVRLSQAWLARIFADERGENAVVQFDGPPMAYYDAPRRPGFREAEDVRYEYQTVKWQSADLGRLEKRVAQWAAEFVGSGEHIVWRWRPELRISSGRFFFFCRLHVLPYRRLLDATPEGEMAPEA